MRRLYFGIVAAFVILGSVSVGVHEYANRPLILTNGRFLTMDAGNSAVEAIGIEQGLIVARGESSEVLAAMSQRRAKVPWYKRLLSARIVDLQGKNVVPGFVDAHSHFPANGLVSIGVDVSSPPFGTLKDISALLSSISQQSEQQSARQWIIGFNYDDAALVDARHPTRQELDNAAPDHAVYLWHRSGHMGVANTRALRELGYDPEAIETPQNAFIGRDAQGRMTGLLQESAAASMNRLLTEVSWWRMPAILFSARDDYLRAGVTTLQNGFADKATLQLLRVASFFGLLPQRILVWPAHDKLADADKAVSGKRLAGWPETDQRTVKIGAIKLIADGSPQGRTAWLSEPYERDTTLSPDYAGQPTIAVPALHELILDYHRAGYQLAIHGNGDAAIQSIIDGLRKAQVDHPRPDARHFIVHAQTIRQSQLEALAVLNISASFFPSHTFFWGDWHRQRVLGEARAQFISPLASADAAGVRYTIHADTPVTPMNPMQMLWSASERRTFSGYLLGANQKVSRLRALRAMTIDAAWQNHLEADRGSLEIGKLADLVVLSGDPLSAREVRSITPAQVWIGGKRYLP